MNRATPAVHSTVDPANMLDHLPVSTRQTVIFALCFVLNMIDGMDVVVISYAVSGVMAEFDIGPVQMGGVFSAGLIGMAIGSLVLGSYADALGRRALVISVVALIALAVILGGLSRSVTQLLITRVIAGFGIGGLVAGVTALTAEYAPVRIRNSILMMVTSGYPLGALLTGLISSWTIPEYGWRATMIGAGFLTAAMIVPCLLFLSESLSLLARKGGARAVGAINRQMQIMRHPPIGGIAPDFLEHHGKFRVGDLLNSTYRPISLRLWTGLICTFMVMYYLLSWIPGIAFDSGLAPGNAIVAAAMFSGGGFIGVFMVGLLADRIGYVRAIGLYCLAAFVMMLIYATYRGELAVVLLLPVLMGFTVQGAVGAFFGAAARRLSCRDEIERHRLDDRRRTHWGDHRPLYRGNSTGDRAAPAAQLSDLRDGDAGRCGDHVAAAKSHRH